MSPPAVHQALPCPNPHDRFCAGPVPCCGIDLCRPRKWKRADDAALVTCARCLRWPGYRDAS